MIQSKNLSRDYECKLFLSVYYPNEDKKHDHNDTESEKIDLSFSCCDRCGEIGHRTEDCPKTNEEIYQLLDQIEAETRDYTTQLLARTPEKYGRDQFGPYLVSEFAQNKVQKSWENTVFCINCGEEGHLWHQCKHRPFNEVVAELPKDGPISPELYRNVFEPAEGFM